MDNLIEEVENKQYIVKGPIKSSEPIISKYKLQEPSPLICNGNISEKYYKEVPKSYYGEIQYDDEYFKHIEKMLSDDWEGDGEHEYDYVQIDLINDNISRIHTCSIIEHLYEYVIEYDSNNCINIKLSYIKKDCLLEEKRRYNTNYKFFVRDLLKANCSLERIGHITFNRLMNDIKELYNISIHGEYNESFKEMFIKDFVKIAISQ